MNEREEAYKAASAPVYDEYTAAIEQARKTHDDAVAKAFYEFELASNEALAVREDKLEELRNEYFAKVE